MMTGGVGRGVRVTEKANVLFGKEEFMDVTE